MDKNDIKLSGAISKGSLPSAWLSCSEPGTKLYRDAAKGHYLHPDTIKVPAHGSVSAPEGFTLQSFRTTDANVITHRYRKGVQPVISRTCYIFQLLAQSMEERE